MSKKNPITVSSWTLGDQCKFEDRVIAAGTVKRPKTPSPMAGEGKL